MSAPPLSADLYPNPIDRYRLIRTIVRAFRWTSRSSSTGTDLAKLVGVSQGTISNLENLEKSIQRPSRLVSREEMLNILRTGLQLSAEQASVLLWLYDSEPPQQPGKPMVASLRSPIVGSFVGLLEETQVRLQGSKKSKRHGTFVFTTEHPDAGLEEERQLFKIEQVPGQRLLVTAFPSGLSRPEEERFTPDCLEKARPMLMKRMALFRKNLAQFGERSIHCRLCVERYLTPRPKKGIDRGVPSWSLRKRHIEEWIDLLESYPHYQVALASTTPDQEFEVKLGSGAMLQGWAHPSHDVRQWGEKPGDKWGPRFIYSSDLGVQVALVTAFERKWASIPRHDKLKRDILKMLKNALASA